MDGAHQGEDPGDSLAVSHVPTGRKVCRKCLRKRDTKFFRIWRKYGAKDREYLKAWCEDCENEYARQWRARNPSYHREWSARYRAL